MVVFLFLVAALVIVVAAVTLVAVGGGERGVLPEAAPERWADPLPWDRPLGRDDVQALRFPLAVRGYRMSDVDDALGRLGAELAERDARIADLESALAAAPAGSGGYAPPAPHPPGGLTGPVYDAGHGDGRPYGGASLYTDDPPYADDPQEYGVNGASRYEGHGGHPGGAGHPQHGDDQEEGR